MTAKIIRTHGRSGIRNWLFAYLFFGLCTSLSFAQTVPGSVPVPEQGTWTQTLQARYFTSDHTSGPDAYYDTTLNITWLADANYSVTQYLATGIGRGSDWYSTMAWASGLDVKGVIGWRLPTVDPYGGYHPTGELSSMFITTLGNPAAQTPEGQAGSYYISNPGPFKNVIPDPTIYVQAYNTVMYWSGTTSPWDSYKANVFSTFDLSQFNTYNKTSVGFRAWVVHDGDVGMPAVPEPSSAISTVLGIVCVAMAVKKARRT